MIEFMPCFGCTEIPAHSLRVSPATTYIASPDCHLLIILQDLVSHSVSAGTLFSRSAVRVSDNCASGSQQRGCVDRMGKSLLVNDQLNVPMEGECQLCSATNWIRA